MMKSLSEVVTRGVGKHSLALQEKSPKLLFVGGVVGMVGSTVLACRSTLRVHEVLDDIQNDLDMAKATRKLHPSDYSQEELQKDTAIIYARSGVAFARLYGPSIVLGAASIALLSKSHNILEERNAGLTAAYIALDKGFKEYRQRVVDKYGPEQDEEFRYQTETISVKQENGKSKKTVRVAPGTPSIYARFFDETSPMWSPQAEYNALYLNCQQNWANDLLNARGHVFLNEVYERLGIPHSSAGAVVGWIRGEGDSYIDFGVWRDDAREMVREFVNGREGSILLDFNVDGPIYMKIEEGKDPSWQ